MVWFLARHQRTTWKMAIQHGIVLEFLDMKHVGRLAVEKPAEGFASSWPGQGKESPIEIRNATSEWAVGILGTENVPSVTGTGKIVYM
jgi:hypothetical protein